MMTSLSIADLMVGVSSIEKVVEEVLKLKSSICYSYGISFVAVEGLFGCASISFPVLISFERLYAIVWPYHHRAVLKRPYIWSIGVAGFLSETTAAIRLLTAFNLMTFDNFFWFKAVYLCLALLMTICSYATTRFFSKNPRLPTDRHKQNKKLSKTLFMVTLLSLITWFPSNISHALLLSITKSCGTSWYDYSSIYSPSKFIY